MCERCKMQDDKPRLGMPLPAAIIWSCFTVYGILKVIESVALGFVTGVWDF